MDLKILYIHSRCGKHSDFNVQHIYFANQTEHVWVQWWSILSENKNIHRYKELKTNGWIELILLTERNQVPALRLSSSAQVNIAAGVSVRLGKTSWMLVVRRRVRSCIRKGTPSKLQIWHKRSTTKIILSRIIWQYDKWQNLGQSQNDESRILPTHKYLCGNCYQT